MRTVTALLLATLSTSGAAQAATLTARVENGNTLIVVAKGGAHDESCSASIHFQYRDPAAPKDSEKHDGAQNCSAAVIPAGKVVEICRIPYTGATDIVVEEGAKLACNPVKASTAK